MKPFSLLLLLIVSGIIFAMLSRPIECLAELVGKLWHFPARIPTKRLVSAGLQAAGTTGKRSFSGEGWRQAAQY
jgi:hypothetical protein